MPFYAYLVSDETARGRNVAFVSPLHIAADSGQKPYRSLTVTTVQRFKVRCIVIPNSLIRRLSRTRLMISIVQ